MYSLMKNEWSSVLEVETEELAVLDILPAIHALTGSDTTSYIGGHSTKTIWRVFLIHHDLGINIFYFKRNRIRQYKNVIKALS